MPATCELSSVLERQLLIQLGGRLRHARRSRGITTTQMAQQAGLSRMTLSAIEAGEPTPTMGSYLRVMGALGMAGDLALLANPAPQGAPKPLRRYAPVPAPTVLAVHDAGHELQDLQSLMLHEEAVRLMRKQPELVQQAIDTLDRWRAGGPSHARFLWDEWAVILHRRQWRRALSRTRRSAELRQASPLPTVLPAQTRERVLAEIQRLKSGVVVGSTAPTPAA